MKFLQTKSKPQHWQVKFVKIIDASGILNSEYHIYDNKYSKIDNKIPNKSEAKMQYTFPQIPCAVCSTKTRLLYFLMIIRKN
jgi:hypothetical protein